MVFLIEEEQRNSVKQNVQIYGEYYNGSGISWLLDVFTSWETLFAIAFLILIRNNLTIYYIKFIFGYIVINLCALTVIPLCLFRPKNPSNFCHIYPYVVSLTKFYGVKWELRGSEILAVDRAAVLMINHQSVADLNVLGSIYPTIKKGVLVIRRLVMFSFPLSLLIYLSSAIFIDRTNGKSANEKLLRSIGFIKKIKAKLIIFPEGKRNLNGDTLLPFKKGGFRLAISGQIPIIPLVISPYYFIDPKKKLFTHGNVIMKVLEPISTEGLTIDDIDELVENTQKLMCAEYKRLKDEVLAKDSI
ncbi:1-acyl-sn-glycerol-3-phosphate acyltransferase beta-like [Lycorma delicatula]|uniref:1-acyl-sn-glycerol-3-phosphate acyltransferase beta-like n=1 Tax=Lycorma delicatula TaxID=130591 RepID=UPI003F5152A2